MLRRTAILTTSLLSAGLLAVPASGSVTATPAPASASSIAWSTCADPDLTRRGLQCGSLVVPLDHADPTGSKITLALTRKPHTGTYQGAMLTNPGGPGGSGLLLPLRSELVPGGAGAGYDWIGFDPRGVGASSPSLHCVRNYFGYDRPSYVPRKAWIKRFWLRKSRDYAAACADTAAERALLPHLTTRDSVQDMEAIRAALGEQRLNFYGFSYGSYLGQVYATRYPTRVGRFVLDGVVNPNRVWYAANQDQNRAFDANMSAYWRYLGAHPEAFGLGTRWRAIERGYYRTLRQLDRTPAANGRLGPSELADTMLAAGYNVRNWATLGREYADLVLRGRGEALLSRYRQAHPADDNSYAVYNAVQCTDTAWPGLVRTLRDAWATHRRAPFLTWANTWYNAPCLSWQAPPRTKPPVSGRAVTSKILLVSETRDAATPYSGALAARSLFPSSSLIAGVGGTTHSSSLSGVACVDDAVAAYLRTGAVPTRLSGTRADLACPRLREPDPFAPEGRSGARLQVDRLSTPVG
jgi:pimeloyl-ACP methyl ester carboxylesterase